MLTYVGREHALPIIEGYLSRVRDGIKDSLSHYEPASHLGDLLSALQGIEELVNIVLAEAWDEKDCVSFASLRLVYGDASSILAARNLLSPHFSAEVVKRVCRTIASVQDYAATSQANDGPDVAGQIGTVLEVALYLQHRRRLLIASLYAIPTHCCGDQKATPFEGVIPFLDLSDRQWMFAVNMFRERLLAHLHPDYSLTQHGSSFYSNKAYEPLDWMALEPERLSAADMVPTGAHVLKDPPPVGVVFSVQEIRNQIAFTIASFQEFELEKTEFSDLMSVVIWSLEFCTDNYHLRFPLQQLLDRIQQIPNPLRARSLLIHESGALLECLNVYCPFVRIGGDAVTCLPLLTRFMNHMRNAILNRRKRYQIRSGFLFEDLVRRRLEELGLAIEPAKRINRKEFDVIARMGDILINIQCKNNEVALERVESAPAVLARYFKQLRRYYTKALAKEEYREDLLRSKYGAARIAHLVLTKSAAPHDDPRVLSFSEIDRLLKLAASHAA